VATATARLGDSILDATGATRVAYAALDGAGPGGALTLLATTVVGKVHAAALPLVSNSILLAALAPAGETWTAPVRAERKQQGCLRFSYVPPGTVGPHRHRCQPDLEIAAEIERRERKTGTPLGAAERAAIAARTAGGLVPGFTALRYGLAGYAQLRDSAPGQIRTGADDEAEMGAFHALYQPQRETNLRVRLDEYLRFGLEAGVIHAS
jgi:hypothetical protein